MEFCRIHLDEVDSTNNYAANWLYMTKSVQPAVITARVQHKGRGQRENQWISPKNQNLTCSFIAFPKDVTIDTLGYLNKGVANAVHKTLSTFLAKPIDIKWPNDLWIQGKKIAGILIENTLRSQWVTHSIIGVGINVNQAFDSQQPWCSLLSITQRSHSIEEVLQVLQIEISSLMKNLGQMEYASIEEYYHQKLLNMGQIISYQCNGSEQKGWVKGVDQWGRIIVQKDGHTAAYHHGEVVIEYH